MSAYHRYDTTIYDRYSLIFYCTEGERQPVVPVDAFGRGSGEVGGLFSSFAGVQSSSYWSSTTSASSTVGAWVVFMFDGNGFSVAKAGNGYVWPVRGGQ